MSKYELTQTNKIIFQFIHQNLRTFQIVKGIFDWVAYWDNLIGSIIMGEPGFVFFTEDDNYIIQE